MKRIAASCLVGIVLCFIPLAGFAAKEVKVEVLYMNHGPLQSSLQQIKDIFSRYGNRVTISWYDFESKEGEHFMAEKGLTQHLPLVIWLDDKNTFPVNGKDIKFIGFPTGSGPAFFQGKWTMEDLRSALDRLTGTK
jgi:hypothetical protein